VKQDKNQAIQLYKESSENDCTKAMLALAALNEPINTQEALWYYDHAAAHEPYALYKLGEFMENGLQCGKLR
jgi:TPR repeat protein